MNATLHLHWVAVAFSLLMQGFLFLRWLHKRLRDDEITRAFVRDMATNHLPHIYNVLQRLCRQQGIAGSNSPAVRWIDMNGTED
jgi:hypothetical protein